MSELYVAPNSSHTLNLISKPYSSVILSIHSAGFSWIYHHSKNAENLFHVGVTTCQNSAWHSAIKPGGVLLGEKVRAVLGSWSPRTCREIYHDKVEDRETGEVFFAYTLIILYFILYLFLSLNIFL